jgi:negative regulator of sigma E activity
MSSGPFDVEQLLRQALRPVEPPKDFAVAMEARLSELTELAQDELEAWELTAMRDPRNWVRPVAAGAVAATAGTALVLLRVRQSHRRRRAVSHDVLDLAGRTLRDAGREARKVFDRG